MKQDELKKGKDAKALLSEYFIFVIFIVIVIGLTILKPSFITPKNLVNILKQASINGILAFGMMFVIISGGFDMSVGSTVAWPWSQLCWQAWASALSTVSAWRSATCRPSS